MNRLIVLVGLLSLFQSAYSQQKQPIEKRISDDICECFGAYGFEVADQRINQAMDTCSNKTVKNYQAELEAYFAASKNADYNTGYQAGKLFFQQKVAPPRRRIFIKKGRH